MANIWDRGPRAKKKVPQKTFKKISSFTTEIVENTHSVDI